MNTIETDRLALRNFSKDDDADLFAYPIVLTKRARHIAIHEAFCRRSGSSSLSGP
jgi:hypothetical protein